MIPRWAPAAILSAGLALAACGDDAWRSGGILVTSPSFAPGERIPKRHAYVPEGENVSPELVWSGAPEGTRQYAVIVDDPDAGPPTFVHWVAWGIPGSATGLPEGVPSDEPTPNGLVQGMNGWGRLGWGGPLPPEGAPAHHYAFWVYALDAPLSLPAGTRAAEVIAAMRGHVLATGRMVARYR